MKRVGTIFTQRDLVNSLVVFFSTFRHSLNSANWTNLFIQFTKSIHQNLKYTPLFFTHLTSSGFKDDSKSQKYFKWNSSSIHFLLYFLLSLLLNPLPLQATHKTSHLVITSLPLLPLSVPSLQFQVLFTLISQFFSTFLRSTSPLSVSISYLGLDEIYHPFYEEFPIFMTLQWMTIWINSSVKSYMSLTFSRHDFHHASPSTRQSSIHSSHKDIWKSTFQSTSPFYLLPLLSWIFIRHY